MTEHNTQELVAKLRAIRGDAPTVRTSCEAADLIEAQAAEMGRLTEQINRQHVIYGGAHAALTRAGVTTEDGAHVLEIDERVSLLLTRATKAEAALAAHQRRADRQADEMTDRHHADQAALAAMTTERDAALAQAAEIERLKAKLDAGREIMRQAWHCLNSFRAQYGNPYCLSEEPFDAFLQILADALGDDCKPWMTDAAAHLIALTNERAELLDRVIDDLAEELGVEPDNEAMHGAIQAIKEARDAALAQVAAMREALEGLADVIEYDGGVDPCVASMAPAEHYLGLAREALSAPADGLATKEEAHG